MNQIDPDFEDFFQNLDSNDSWLEDPIYEPDWEELEREKLLAENEQRMMAAWWEMEGVRCWTFGKPRNPYHDKNGFN